MHISLFPDYGNNIFDDTSRSRAQSNVSSSGLLCWALWTFRCNETRRTFLDVVARFQRRVPEENSERASEETRWNGEFHLPLGQPAATVLLRIISVIVSLAPSRLPPPLSASAYAHASAFLVNIVRGSWTFWSWRTSAWRTREDGQDESIAFTSSVFVVADTRKWVPFPLHRDEIVAIVVKRIFSYSSGAISFIVWQIF